MVKKDMKGGKSGPLPKEKWERNEGEMGHECNEKYASEFGNPEDLDRSTKGLADYCKKNKMKY
jgi:hypothetical protein